NAVDYGNCARVKFPFRLMRRTVRHYGANVAQVKVWRSKIQHDMIIEVSWELRIDASSDLTKLHPQAGKVDCASARFSEIGCRLVST
ncbi:hypothetical protein, partial [Sinorhizobium medicae]